MEAVFFFFIDDASAGGGSDKGVSGGCPYGIKTNFKIVSFKAKTFSMESKPSAIHALIEEFKKFRDVRGWAQFHNSVNMAIALNIEIFELLVIFLWKKQEDADKENQ